MLIKVAKFVINVVPEATANFITRSLAAMTQRPPISSSEQEAMAQASRMNYGENNVAWAWGDWPLVIFVHGSGLLRMRCEVRVLTSAIRRTTRSRGPLASVAALRSRR